ncbi:MAG: hypothetical protein JSS10_00365 [Verrucomicrobia bacterium]|nr:hypothetical protein [Verrucomicrobiota bacterium]
MAVIAQPQIASLYDRLGLAKLFPKAEFGSPKMKDFVGHFYFAYREGAPVAVLKYIDENLKPSCKSCINKPYSEHRLTALHIVVIKNNSEGARALLQRGADIDAEDAYGLTAWLQTALLADYVTIKNTLESHKAKKDEAKWQQLRKSAGFVPNAPSIERCTFTDENKVSHPLTSDYCRSAFGMESYTDDVIFGPSEHIYLWQLFNASSQDTVTNVLLAKTSRCPQLSVQLITGLSPAGPQRARGLILCQPLERCDFIGFYGARATMLKQNPKVARWQIQDYFQRSVVQGDSKEDYYCQIDLKNRLIGDAYSTGNIIRFANDGWPLMIEYRFYGPRIGVFALQAQQAGIELTWDYGITCSQLKWGNYRLLNKSDMVQFFVEEPILTLFQKIGAKEKNLQTVPCRTIEEAAQKSIELAGYQARFKFVFNTPLAMIYLCLNQTIKASEVINLLTSNPSLVQFLQMRIYQPHYFWLVQTLILLELVEKCLDELPQNDKNIVCSFFLHEIIDHYSVIQVVKGLVHLRAFLRENLERKKDIKTGWDKFKDELKQKIRNYSLEKDAKPPLALFKDNTIIFVREGRADEVLHHLHLLQPIDDTSRNTHCSQETYDWCENYNINIYSNFV